MEADERELERLRGRLEALLITIGGVAGRFANLIGPPPEAVAAPGEKLQYLISAIQDNQAFSAPRALAEEGARLCRLYEAQPDAPITVIRELIHGAASVMAGLEQFLSVLTANAEANARLEKMQMETGGERRLTIEQQIALSGHDIERQKIVAEAGANLLNAAITFAGASIKSLLLLNGGAAVAMLAFIGSAAKNIPAAASAISLAFPLYCFGLGAASAVLVAMGAYLSQIAFYGHYVEPGKWQYIAGQIFRALAVGTAVFSISAFIKGLYAAYSVFLAAS